jgi:hypothetical protein
MTFVEYEQSYIFSSAERNGARNRSDDGSTFDVQLSGPIAIPKEAVNCTIEVTQANIWYTTPNISARLNNTKFRFFSSGGYGSTTTLDFPDGLYSVSALNNQLGLLLVNKGFPADFLTISGDDATQKTVITYGAAGIALDFSGGDTFKDILGFDDLSPGNYPLSTAAGQNFTGQNVASFNTLNSYLIHSDLVSQGIPVNANGASILAQVPISSRPGSQIVYQPQNPSRTDLTELIGLPRSSFRIWLTNQVGDYIDTNGEDYSIVVVLRYVMPIMRGAAGSNTF